MNKKQRGGYESHWETEADEIQFFRDMIDTVMNTSTELSVRLQRIESFYKSIPHLRFLIRHKRFA